MKCPICRRQNSQSAHFCTYCGAALDSETRMLQAGQMVDGGTYRIIRPLGKGGMGAVYLAANTKAFGRQCVVKEVIEYYDPTDPTERQKAIRRFELEARTLASLKHPGIPDIYAYFSEQGRNYLVMEYIEGPNLSQGLTRPQDEQIVKGHPQPVKDVIPYAIQVCKVLDYLEKHQPPVIHNDIKPANIILDKNSGQAVLVDFGTAKTRYTRQTPGQPGRQQSSVYGTVGYAAAELYNGQAEPRSDVYALAATVYHLLTDDDPRGHPFQFPQMDTIPKPLHHVLRKALNDNVDERPLATQFGQQLQQALDLYHPQPGSAALVRPLTFPNGANATTRAELISLCIENWDYAGDILYDGSIAHWLSDALHDPIAARTAKEAVNRYDDEPNAALEYLIRSLDPKAMPDPHLNVVTGRLKYERVVGQDTSQEIRVSNTGGGYLYGTVTSSAPWVKVQGRVQCAPGQTQSLPIAIDADSLTPGQTHRAKVDIHASGAQSASIAIEVRVPPPSIAITPMQIDLGTVSRKQLFTDKASFEVQNTGQSRAVCQIESIPPWLVLAPTSFVCLRGQAQVIELRGRVDQLPAKGLRHRTTLEINIEGRHDREVEVMVRTRTGEAQSRRLSSVVVIGFAILFLFVAIAFFLIAIGLLPLGL